MNGLNALRNRSFFARPALAALGASLLLAAWAPRGAAAQNEAAPAIPEATLAAIIQHEDLRDSAPMLEMLSGSDNAAVRARAALAIGRAGLPGDVPALVAALNDEAEEVRVAAAFALGEAIDAGTLAEIGVDKPNPEAIAALADTLRSDDSREARRRAAEALGKSAASDAVVAVAQMANSARNPNADEEDIRDFELCAMSLVRLGAVDAASILREAAGHAEPRIRSAATHALWRMRDAQAAPIARAGLSDSEPLVRAYAASLLGAVGGPEDVDALVAAMKGDEALGPRIEATRAIGRLGGPAATIALRERAGALGAEYLDGGGSDWVDANGARANELVVAIDALAEIDITSAMLDLLDKLRADANAVGLRALVAHAKIAQRSGEPKLFMSFPPNFSAQAPESARALAQALGEARTSESLELLGKMLGARGAPIEVAARLKLVRPDLLQSMNKYDIGNSKEFLAGLLEDSDLHVRVRAVSLLAPEDGPPPSDELVAELAKAYKADLDVVPDGRLALLDALGRRLDLGSTTEILRSALQDADRLVRMRAVKLLGLGTHPDLPLFLGRRRSVQRSLTGPMAMEEFYRGVAERAQKKRVYALIRVAARGSLLLELFPEEAPIAVENFVRLAERQYFAGQSFHRVVPDFVIQGGDPRQDMEGGPGHSIPCEINMRPYLRGTLGMALSGKDTGGSQFFICHAPQPRLDGGYTVFGQLLKDGAGIPGHPELADVKGCFDALDAITQYDPIVDVTIYEVDRDAASDAQD